MSLYAAAATASLNNMRLKGGPEGVMRTLRGLRPPNLVVSHLLHKRAEKSAFSWI